MGPAVSNARGRGRGRRGRMPELGKMPPGTIPKNPTRPQRGPGGMLSQFGGGRVNPPGQGMMNPPGQGPARSTSARGRGASANGAGVGGAALPGPGGRQLQARVSSGVITAEQAQRTMQQRQTLQKAFGDSWRDKLQVGGKSFAQVNAGLKKNPENAKLAALRKKLLANRKTVLAGARGKGKESEE